MLYHMNTPLNIHVKNGMIDNRIWNKIYEDSVKRFFKMLKDCKVFNLTADLSIREFENNFSKLKYGLSLKKIDWFYIV